MARGAGRVWRGGACGGSLSAPASWGKVLGDPPLPPLQAGHLRRHPQAGPAPCPPSPAWLAGRARRSAAQRSAGSRLHQPGPGRPRVPGAAEGRPRGASPGTASGAPSPAPFAGREGDLAR